MIFLLICFNLIMLGFSLWKRQISTNVCGKAHGLPAFDVLSVHRALCTGLIVRARVGVFCDKASQKIVRCGTRVVLLETHSATCQETQ